jgi:hypothetical protein
MEAVFSVRWSVPWLYNESPLVANLDWKYKRLELGGGQAYDRSSD